MIEIPSARRSYLSWLWWCGDSTADCGSASRVRFGHGPIYRSSSLMWCPAFAFGGEVISVVHVNTDDKRRSGSDVDAVPFQLCDFPGCS